MPQPGHVSLIVFVSLLTIALTREGSLSALFLARLQIERVSLDFFDDVFSLHLAFKPPQSTFKRFPILQVNFRRSNSPPPNHTNTIIAERAGYFFLSRRAAAQISLTRA